MKLLLLSLLLSTCVFSCFSQEENNGQRYIKIVISHDVTAETERSITEAFVHLNGVQVSRMDNLNHTFLAVYTPGENLSKQTFTNWFENNGYVISCFYDDVYIVGKMINLSKNNCH